MTVDPALICCFHIWPAVLSASASLRPPASARRLRPSPPPVRLARHYGTLAEKPLASTKSVDNRHTFHPISPESSVSPAISLPHTRPDLSNLLNYSPGSGAPAETSRPDWWKSSNGTGHCPARRSHRTV